MPDSLYYAVGGGMGHLTRAVGFIHTHGLDERQTIVLTASPYVKKILRTIHSFQLPHELSQDIKALQGWLVEFVKFHKIKNIYIDVFPSGIMGEWNDFPIQGITFFHVARLLNWESYKKNIYGKQPYFKKVFSYEYLTNEHHDYLLSHCDWLEVGKLEYPVVVESGELPDAILNIQRPIWLIVHSESTDEILALYEYAIDVYEAEGGARPVFCVVSPLRCSELPDEVMQFDIYPAFHLYEKAQRIFTGAGFNSILQTNSYRKKQYILPFNRRYDNQFLRAKIAKDYSRVRMKA